MSNIINDIQGTFHSPANDIHWQCLDFSPYEENSVAQFRARFSKFPEEFYRALEDAEQVRRRKERVRYILKHGLLRQWGTFIITFS